MSHSSAYGISEIRPKKCRYCKQEFQPARPLQSVCDWECGHALILKRKADADAKAEKARHRETNAKLEAIKPRSQWIREAQQAVNAYVRERDRMDPCISCGRHHQGQYHAGHYLSTGARPGLRFDERNIHKQCQPCNTHLSGNLVLYRAALILKISLSAVESMEADTSIKKFSIAELKAIKAEYRVKLKELKSGE